MRRTTTVMEADTDHDLLITLVETVRNNHQMVLGKIEDLKTDIMDLRMGANTKLDDHENRIRSLEKTRDEVNPLEFANMAREAFAFAKSAKDEQKRALQRHTLWVTLAVSVINVVISVLTGGWPIRH